MNILLTWLWQGILVAGLTTVALRGAPRASADTRHAAWWVALTAVLGIPLTLVATRAAQETAAAGTVVDAIPSAVALPSVPPWLGLTFAVAWALTGIVGVIRLAHRWRAARALARRSAPFDAIREARLPLWSQARAAAQRPAELRMSDDIGAACAIGFRRPIILVGRRLAGVLDDAALDSDRPARARAPCAARRLAAAAAGVRPRRRLVAPGGLVVVAPHRFSIVKRRVTTMCSPGPTRPASTRRRCCTPRAGAGETRWPSCRVRRHVLRHSAFGWRGSSTRAGIGAGPGRSPFSPSRSR